MIDLITESGVVDMSHSRKRSKKNGYFVVFCQKRLRFRSRSATFDCKTQKKPFFTSGFEWQKDVLLTFSASAKSKVLL